MGTSSERVMIFIDGSNLFCTWQRNRPGQRYSLNKLIELLTNGRKLIRPYYFGSERVPPRPSQIRFYDGLQYDGIDVTTRKLKLRTRRTDCQYAPNGVCEQTFHIEKGVDVALITRMLSFGFKSIYDIAVLVSGDADYTEAVEEIRNLGRRIEIVAFPNSIAAGLRKLADKFISLDEIADKILM